MKTIEERAKALYNDNAPDYGPGGTPEMYGYDNGYQQGIYDGYIAGATDQKEIDDRRYDFFKKNMVHKFASWVNDNPQGIHTLKEWLNLFEQFAND